jgi:hypothetical protein
MASQVVSVQSSTPLEVNHMCLAQKAESLRQFTESLEIWYAPSWLPDGTAELLDDVNSEVLECIQCGDHFGHCRGLLPLPG